jgi:hypothetical protein
MRGAQVCGQRQALPSLASEGVRDALQREPSQLRSPNSEMFE